MTRSAATKAGLERARAKGSSLGRPRVELDLAAARKMRSTGASWSEIAAALQVPRSTVRRALERGTR